MVVCLLIGALPMASDAFDASASKEPGLAPSSGVGGGKSFNIFSGDPKRVQKVNQIDREDFELEAKIEPTTVTLPAEIKKDDLPVAKVALLIKSKANRPKTFSFPDAQRIDAVIKDAAGNEVYRWSADKQFVQAIGTSMVMPNEKLSFQIDIPFKKINPMPPSGDYAIEITLANYPTFVAKTKLAMTNNAPQETVTAQNSVAPVDPVAPMPAVLPPATSTNTHVEDGP